MANGTVSPQPYYACHEPTSPPEPAPTKPRPALTADDPADRSDRFVWKPGDIRIVRKSPNNDSRAVPPTEGSS